MVAACGCTAPAVFSHGPWCTLPREPWPFDWQDKIYDRHWAAIVARSASEYHPELRTAAPDNRRGIAGGWLRKRRQQKCGYPPG